MTMPGSKVKKTLFENDVEDILVFLGINYLLLIIYVCFLAVEMRNSRETTIEINIF